MTNNILVIAAHPDDEVLGAGGSLIKHIKKNDEVSCLILSGGITSRDNHNQEEVKTLRCQSQEASKIIGFKRLFLCQFPDNQFDSIPLLNIVKEIEKYLEIVQPDIIYTHHGEDVNIDHQLTHKAVMTACRPCNTNCPKQIYAFETLSSTEWQLNPNKFFTPNIYINIENEIEQKIEAFNKYQSEIREFPHPRSVGGIKILANYRGLQSGLRFAEAFKLLRKIKK